MADPTCSYKIILKFIGEGLGGIYRPRVLAGWLFILGSLVVVLEARARKGGEDERTTNLTGRIPARRSRPHGVLRTSPGPPAPTLAVVLARWKAKPVGRTESKLLAG